MKPLVLRAYIRPLPEYLPRTKALENKTRVGVGFDGAWYRSQKEHWLGWLSEYNGPGAYGRSDSAQRNGQYIYNHVQCAPMLFWLAEALNLDKVILDAAFDAVAVKDTKGATQCAALRTHIDWKMIESGLVQFEYGLVQTLRIKLADHQNLNGG